MEALLQMLVRIVLYLNAGQAILKKKSAKKISPPKVYKGTWTSSEFIKIMSYFLETLCMMCECFFYQMVTIQIICKTWLTLMNPYFIWAIASVVLFLFWKWYTYFKIKTAILTANIIISVSQEDHQVSFWWEK